MRKTGGDLEPLRSMAGMTLLFAAGSRPTAREVERVLADPLVSGRGAQVGHRPRDDQGWLELLASGLTFDLRGLAPAGPAANPAVAHVYGLPPDIEKFVFEAALLVPGAHIAAGGALLPVVRTLVGLAAGLALELPVAAVCWNPASVWMEPRYFSRIALNWLAGGAFPALGLTGLRVRPEGDMESEGLAYFIGQEVHLRLGAGVPKAEATKIAVRVIDHLMRHGPLDRPEGFAGPKDQPLTIAPSPDGRRVLVERPA